jgi:membrane associated rhomboid family serine protease
VSADDPRPPTSAADYVSIFSALARRPCEERALVLKAMDIEHLVVERTDGCHVLVMPQDVARAGRELALYSAENAGPRSAPLALPPAGRGLTAAAVFPAAILAMFFVEAGYLFDRDWLSAGESVAARVQQGEWWRAVTALTLHADLAHVAGNAVFGAFFAYLAGQYLGSGLALLEITLAGAAGNAANAWLQGADHRSIGASTAVFAALGIVAVHAWIDRRGWARGWARRSAPLVGALALLTYLGTGDEHTDIVAHLTGFLMGLAGGFAVAGRRTGWAVRRSVDAALGLLAGLLIAFSWWIALYPAKT